MVYQLDLMRWCFAREIRDLPCRLCLAPIGSHRRWWLQQNSQKKFDKMRQDSIRVQLSLKLGINYSLCFQIFFTEAWSVKNYQHWVAIIMIWYWICAIWLEIELTKHYVVKYPSCYNFSFVFYETIWGLAVGNFISHKGSLPNIKESSNAVVAAFFQGHVNDGGGYFRTHFISCHMIGQLRKNKLVGSHVRTVREIWMIDML